LGGVNECDSGTTNTPANDLRHGNPVRSSCESYLSHADYEKQKVSEGAILDRKPMPALPKILLTGLIVSVIWALAIIILGRTKSGFTMGTPDILTLVCGIPAGTVAFTLVRLLKNLINKGATAIGSIGKGIGGNLLSWVVTNALLWGSPLIVDLLLANLVFKAKLF